MAKRLQLRRLVGLGMVLCAAFLALGYRLVDLQVFQHQTLSAKAQKNTKQETFLEPRRGDILDVKGNILATSVLVKTVCADPALVANHQAEVARILSPLLEKPESELTQRLVQAARRNDKGEITNHFVVLKRKVSVATWQQIQSAITNLVLTPEERKLYAKERLFYSQVVYARDDQKREYPNQNLASHILGFATSEDILVNGKEYSQLRGQEGVELTFDSKLKGVRGWRVTQLDRQKRELVPYREQDVEPHDGMDVFLTIDSVIQHIVETVLAEAMQKHSPVSASCIVIRPRTGEVLALANLPDYDLNKSNDSTPEQRRNRIVTDCAEPGSTFKIVVISGALNEGIVTLKDEFDCEHRHFSFAGKVLHDHESYGPLSVEWIIGHSSNIGSAKVGIKMGQNKLYDYICNYGFGARTGIPLPGEVVGIVHPLKKWSKVSIAQIPMGQGIAVTRLQMIMAMSAIANNGVLMRPMLVDRLEDRDHHVMAKYSPQRVRRVISEEAAKSMVTALKLVVSTNGTGAKAALEHYSVAGKTGTAQKVENGVYAPGKYFTSFIGFFPADSPEVCISVVLDEPDVRKGYYGGSTAAPLFKQIAEGVASYLNIRPDDNEGPGMPELVKPPETRTMKTAARSP